MTETVNDAQCSSATTYVVRAVRLAVLAVIIAIVAAGVGFLVFASHIGEMHAETNPPKSDAIVVLTGGQNRLEEAMDLLSSGKGKRLLISGVHPHTRKKDLRRALHGDPDLFSCCVDLGYAALDTVGNAAESAQWLESRGYKDVLLVTSNYHMPRSLLEARRAYSGITVHPHPVVVSDLGNGNWMGDRQALRILATEYVKYLAALAGASPRVKTSMAAAAN